MTESPTSYEIGFPSSIKKKLRGKKGKNFKNLGKKLGVQIKQNTGKSNESMSFFDIIGDTQGVEQCIAELGRKVEDKDCEMLINRHDTEDEPLAEEDVAPSPPDEVVDPPATDLPDMASPPEEPKQEEFTTPEQTVGVPDLEPLPTATEAPYEVEEPDDLPPADTILSEPPPLESTETPVLSPSRGNASDVFFSPLLYPNSTQPPRPDIETDEAVLTSGSQDTVPPTQLFVDDDDDGVANPPNPPPPTALAADIPSPRKNFSVGEVFEPNDVIEVSPPPEVVEVDDDLDVQNVDETVEPVIEEPSPEPAVEDISDQPVANIEPDSETNMNFEYFNNEESAESTTAPVIQQPDVDRAPEEDVISDPPEPNVEVAAVEIAAVNGVAPEKKSHPVETRQAVAPTLGNEIDTSRASEQKQSQSSWTIATVAFVAFCGVAAFVAYQVGQSKTVPKTKSSKK